MLFRKICMLDLWTSNFGISGVLGRISHDVSPAQRVTWRCTSLSGSLSLRWNVQQVLIILSDIVNYISPKECTFHVPSIILSFPYVSKVSAQRDQILMT